MSPLKGEVAAERAEGARRSLTPQSPVGDSSPFRGAMGRDGKASPERGGGRGAGGGVHSVLNVNHTVIYSKRAEMTIVKSRRFFV